MIKKFYEVFKNSYVQTFDDTKGGKPFTRKFPMSEIADNKEWLLKNNPLGAGVFFTPNPCKGGRKEENITAIDWVYVDMDEGTKEEMMKKIQASLFYPHIITESKRSYHLFWKVSGMDREAFDKIIAGLILFYNGDPAISSTNEVLRLPGFKHTKDLKDQFDIDIKRIDFGIDISAEEMLEAYPEPAKTFQARLSLADDDLGILKSISVVDVLRKLGVEVKQNFIWEDGKKTSASINVAGNYVNRFSGKEGSGSTIDVVMGYGNMELKEAIEWLKDGFGVRGKTSKVEMPKRLTAVDIVAELNRDRKMFTWGTPTLDKEITGIESHHFIIVAGMAGAGKTAFAFDVAMKNANAGFKVLFLSLEMSEKALLVRGARSFAGITKEEWRGRPKTVPDYKLKMFEAKAKELTGCKNLMLRSFPHGIEATSDNTFSMIEALNPDLTVIDNLDLVEKDPMQSEYLEQNRISKAFMDLCHDKHRPVIMIHHENPHTKGVGLGAMRGSGKIGDNCDTQLSCSRSWAKDAEPKENAKFSVLANKDRDFGQWTASQVYFKDGTFVDEYEDKRKVTWTDKI